MESIIHSTLKLIRNDNPDKGTETGVVDYILKVGYKKIRNDNPDKGTETHLNHN